ncbi:uncharacterized protein B0P05DRAFT_541981 [Gilbertella persicaria]|uniref:uncharacterized protein n=1 Tax=Gilbertella persicaria TaxID=101096 RepID=UPI00221EF1F1|nr:uncharacterized protein B0P05DRAFT_541981 [Gilbertella persicaria]KAI8078997.1 hypothetical protein B0P05DRAFT_541981 [Gilbertella persicaria]
MPSEPQLNDMKYTREFKNGYLKTHKQMNWKVCYDKGLAEGYFSRYKNYKTLKSTFNELKNNQMSYIIFYILLSSI